MTEQRPADKTTDEPLATDPAHRTWIVGHDGSEDASNATRWALCQAEARDVALDLIRTWHIPALEFPSPVDDINGYAPREICHDFDALASAAELAGVEMAGRVVSGSASQALLEESETAELLVLGSRGLGGFRRLLLGSVSSQCATHAVVPTVVVPRSAPTDRAVKRIVIGLDGSDRSKRALEWAMRFAPEDCSVLVAGAWMPSKSGYAAVVQHYTNELQQARDRFEQILDDLEASAGRTLFEREFAFADPATTLLRASADADIVVVGQRGHGGLSAAILGSVATHMLHHSKVPVAVVPAAD